MGFYHSLLRASDFVLSVMHARTNMESRKACRREL
jgi:hypothetical protein